MVVGAYLQLHAQLNTLSPAPFRLKNSSISKQFIQFVNTVVKIK